MQQISQLVTEAKDSVDISSSNYQEVSKLSNNTDLLGVYYMTSLAFFLYNIKQEDSM